MAPGMVGKLQLGNGGPRPGYYQPVEFHGPKGMHIAVVEQNRFTDNQPAPVKCGMLMGAAYRLKITRIPGRPGEDVYPTIEVVNRLYPPHGMAERFPVPVHFTQQELELALNGVLVTRVVYLEDPEEPLPVVDRPDYQRWFDAGNKQDPLQVADKIGRPMVIIRMGSRIPEGAEQGFAWGSPPLIRLKPSPPRDLEDPQPLERPGDLEDNTIPEAVPRIPIPRGTIIRDNAVRPTSAEMTLSTPVATASARAEQLRTGETIQRNLQRQAAFNAPLTTPPSTVNPRKLQAWDKPAEPAVDRPQRAPGMIYKIFRLPQGSK